MKTSIFLRLLPFVSGGVHSISHLSTASGIGKTVIIEVLNELTEKGVGELLGSEVRFTSADRLRAALIGISLGCSFGDVSSSLDWRDFESFSKEIFERNEFQVRTDIRLRKPSIQIDLIAYKGSSAFCADCKHWKSPRGISTIREVAIRQIERTKAFMRSEYAKRWRIQEAMPIVITLKEETELITEQVPVVPVDILQDFIGNIAALEQEVAVVTQAKQSSQLTAERSGR